MTPGNPIGLECPHCGKLKFIQSIASGNTFGGVFWSDTKNEFPMFPSPSPVQYCPHCGGYYFIADTKFWYLKDTEINDDDDYYEDWD